MGLYEGDIEYNTRMREQYVQLLFGKIQNKRW